MMAKLTKARNIDIRLSIDLCLRSGKCYGGHVMDFRSHAALLGRSKKSILLVDWSEVNSKLINSIWTIYFSVNY